VRFVVECCVVKLIEQNFSFGRNELDDLIAGLLLRVGANTNVKPRPATIGLIVSLWHVNDENVVNFFKPDFD